MRWLRPIPQDWIPWHLLLFIALFAMGMAMRAAEELPAHPHGDTVGFANAMIDGAVSVIVVSAAISTTIVEGALIFAEKYLKHRYEVGLEKGPRGRRRRGTATLGRMVRSKRCSRTCWRGVQRTKAI